MYTRKTFISTFLILSIISFLLGYANTVVGTIDISYLNPIDIIYIFFVNVVIILSALLFAPVGLPFYYIFNTIFNIGKAAKESGIELYIYIPISLLHGVFEIICLYFLYKISLDYFKIYFKKKISIEERVKKFKDQTGYVLKKYVGMIVLLLFIGSIIEVMISNRVLNFVLKGG
ncbi:stage II sporulation protein M [Salinicoccus carnicancri]|uniref:stage II sporulation protein M n=1 Tax=Salinicoccus carnicancri TaxID=558170 RepID=UPI000372EB24|nr:stage II sporulation protein M [Salinicoccus carnicancri]